MKRLPIGIQSFSEIRKNGYLYVDKTEIIHRLITSGKPFFFARPRRFGKSLLVSTLAEIFKGNKPLFEGLAIYDKWDWSRKYPVIHLDWSSFEYRSLEELRECVNTRILKIAKEYDVEISTQRPRLVELVEALYERHNEQVAVLIDEYDKPMQDAVAKGDKKLLSETRDMLHEIYTSLKACDPYLKFLFLTGISNSAGVSVFSSLNNLNDISLDARYSTICGYTQEELECNFKEHIAGLSQSFPQGREQISSNIKTWYNGYSWDGKTTVYNPFAILRLFDMMKFKNFWSQTGAPSFLINILRKRKRFDAVLGSVTLFSLTSLTDDPAEMDEAVLLFQTGYLTIKEKQTLPSRQTKYTLDFPNMEVKESLLESLLIEYGKCPEDLPIFLRERLKTELLAGDTAALTETLRGLFAWVPYQIIEENENYYHSLMLLWLRLLGFNITAEVSTNLGRIDAVWELPEQIIVAEVKHAKDKTEESGVVLDKLLTEAFGQIEEKRYPERYKTVNKKLTALAIACYEKKIKCEIRKI